MPLATVHPVLGVINQLFFFVVEQLAKLSTTFPYLEALVNVTRLLMHDLIFGNSSNPATGFIEVIIGSSIFFEYPQGRRGIFEEAYPGSPHKIQETQP